MSSTQCLFCPQTNEAVMLLRSGGKGLSPDSDYSNGSLFSFLAYHSGLDFNCTFEICCLDSGGKFDSAHLVSSTDDLKSKYDELDGLEEDPWLILLWDKNNSSDLLARNMELKSELSLYDFGFHGLAQTP